MSDRTFEALLFLTRAKERELEAYVDGLQRTANLRWWHFGFGWRSYAKLALPRAERELEDLQRRCADLEILMAGDHHDTR